MTAALPTDKAGMDLASVQRFALELMAEYGLTAQGWGFGFNRRKQSMGLCNHRHRLIELSVYFITANPQDAILDTLLHEIAHALVGPQHGHDAVWQQKCREIGARPVRCGDADMPQGAWQTQCGGCGQCFDRHRRPGSLDGCYCRRCGPVAGRLVWRRSSPVSPAAAWRPGSPQTSGY